MKLRTASKIPAIACLLGLALSLLAGAAYGTETATFYTCVGGASGMTLTLNPFPGPVVRGCAAQIMDTALMQKNNPPDTGTVKYAYANANISGEPTTFPAGAVKFTGNGSQTEIEYLNLGNGNVIYAVVVRADSILGLRFAVNREKITGFTSQGGTGSFHDGTFPTPVALGDTPGAASDPDWAAVLTDINTKLAAGGIPIEGGLSECYMDSGVKGIDRWNRMFPTATQPQLNSANFSSTKDNLLAIAVLALIYNDSLASQSGINNVPVNFTSEMERMITGGMGDNWDLFFGRQNVHLPMLNFYREPLSGTYVAYQNLLLRGVDPSPNGTNAASFPGGMADVYNSGNTITLNSCADDGVNYHRSGTPDLTCAAKPTDTCLAYKAGSGALMNAVDRNVGAHGYVFLQKFTAGTPGNMTAPYPHIRVGMYNGYAPYDFGSGNSLPGHGNVPDVDSNTSGAYYQNVIDGKYPLWTYDHCFDATNGTSTNLANYVANYELVKNLATVRSVGLIPIADMNGMAMSRIAPAAGSPNVNRGPGFGRCGFVSPVTGETVRDGMMFMLNDPNATSGLPGEPYVEMRP